MTTEKDLTRPMSDICKQVLSRIASESESPLPTPKKGTFVGWLDRPIQNKQKGGLVAVVTARLSPGRVNVEVLGEGQKMIREGATYIAHPDLMNRHNVPNAHGGYWYYLEIEDNKRFRPPKEDFTWHLQALKEQKERCLADEARRQQEAIEREQTEAQLAAQRQAAMDAARSGA